MICLGVEDMNHNLFKEGLVLGVILLFIGVSIAPSMTAINYNSPVQKKLQSFMNTESIVSRYQPFIQRYFFNLPYHGFTAEDITFKDACYHGNSTKLWRPFEWWYFDAVFDNNLARV